MNRTKTETAKQRMNNLSAETRLAHRKHVIEMQKKGRENVKRS